MSTLEQLLTTEAAERDARAAALPPLPVLGEVELGAPIGVPDQIRPQMNLLAKVLKTAAAPITFSVEGLTRFEDAFQASVLTAFGAIPRDQYSSWVKGILFEGKRIDGHTFTELAWGKSFADQLDRMSLIPGWVKKVAAPDGTMMERPKISFGDVFGLAEELLISPYAALSVLPKSVVAATRVDKAMNLLAWPVTMPMRMAGKAIFSPETPWGAFLLRLRDPHAVLPKAMADTLALDAKYLEDSAVTWRTKLTELYEKHGIGVSMIGRIAGKKRNPEIRPDIVFDHLFSKAQVLRPAEKEFVDDVVSQVLRPLKEKLATVKGPDGVRSDMLRLKKRERISIVGSVQNERTIRAGSSVLSLGGEASIVRRGAPQRTLEWVPERDLLRQFHGTPKNFIVPAERIGDKSFKQRTNVFLPWKAREASPFDVKRLPADAKDPVHALDVFAMQAEKRFALYREGSTFAKYRPHTEFGNPKQNPELRGMKDYTFNYWLEKVHSITGNSLRKPDIILNRIGERFWQGILDSTDSVARRSRILSLMHERTKEFFGFNNPRLGRTTSISSVLISRQMQSLLGLNLASGLKNSSQLLNEGAVSGVPAVWRGLFKMIDYTSDHGRILRDARKRAAFGNETAKLAHDNVWASAGGTMSRITMGFFNATESAVRGISFNVHVGEELEKRGIRSFADWENLAEPAKRALVNSGFLHAIETNFVYGMAGRSALMMHPVARFGAALKSYSWKEAEFVSKTFQRDGLAFTRLLALHGWAIETAYHAAGINAESWLGWGFLPPQGRVFDSPGIEIAKDTVGALHAAADGDERAFAAKIDKVRGNIRELFRLFGAADDAPGLQAALSAAATFGLTPIPIIAIGKSAKFVNEFLTGQRESTGGAAWRPVSREEALTSYFFTTHKQVELQRLLLAQDAARRRVDGVLRSRVDRFVSALGERDGDAVAKRAAELVDVIDIGIPLSPVSQLGSFVRDERQFRPLPDMIEDRIRNEMMRRSVSQGVREMVHSGWAGQVLWAEYSRLGLRDLESGAVRLPERTP